jgi:hypothetical protein
MKRKYSTSLGVIWVPPKLYLLSESADLWVQRQQNLKVVSFFVCLALILFFFLHSDCVDLYIKEQNKFLDKIKSSGTSLPDSHPNSATNKLKLWASSSPSLPQLCSINYG